MSSIDGLDAPAGATLLSATTAGEVIEGSRDNSRSRSPSRCALEQGGGAMIDEADASGPPSHAHCFDDVNAPLIEDESALAEAGPITHQTRFQEVKLVVPEDVGVLGFSVTPVHKGWRDIVLNYVAAGSWAQAHGLKVGDEILKLQDMDVLDMDEAAFR